MACVECKGKAGLKQDPAIIAELAEHYYKWAKRCIGYWQKRYYTDPDTIESAAMEGFWLGLNRFDESKGNIHQFVRSYMWGKVKNAWRDERKIRRSKTALAESQTVEWNPDETGDLVDKLTCAELLEPLPRFDAKVLTLLYLNGLTLEEAAVKLYCDPRKVKRHCELALRAIREHVNP